MASPCLHLLDGVEAHRELSRLDFHAALDVVAEVPVVLYGQRSTVYSTSEEEDAQQEQDDG